MRGKIYEKINLHRQCRFGVRFVFGHVRLCLFFVRKDLLYERQRFRHLDFFSRIADSAVFLSVYLIHNKHRSKIPLLSGAVFSLIVFVIIGGITAVLLITDNFKGISPAVLVYADRAAYYERALLFRGVQKGKRLI